MIQGTLNKCQSPIVPEATEPFNALRETLLEMHEHLMNQANQVGLDHLANSERDDVYLIS